MNSASLSLLAAAGAAPVSAGQAFLQSPAPLMIGMFLIVWFLMIRPQMRQQKALKDKISALKKGDQVVTGGGLIGKIAKLDENYVELELAPNVKVRALRSSIADIVPPPGAAND